MPTSSAEHEGAFSLLKQKIVLFGFSFDFCVKKSYVDDYDAHNDCYVTEMGESFGFIGNTAESLSYTSKSAFSSQLENKGFQ